MSVDRDWVLRENVVVRENVGRRFEVGRRGVGRGVAHLGVRASHEVARVVHEIGPYLYEEVSDQRAGSLHPPRLAAAGGGQRRPHQEGHRRRGQRLGSRRGDPPGDVALDFGRPRGFRFTPRVRRIAVPSPRRRSRGPALHDVPSIVCPPWRGQRTSFRYFADVLCTTFPKFVVRKRVSRSPFIRGGRSP